MGLDLTYINGQTPISEEEKEGLLIRTITTRNELDEFEQYNIEKAMEWTIKSHFKLDSIINDKFVIETHKRMLNEVWEWAGKFKTSDKNLGVDNFQIPAELKKLLDDCRYWIDHQTYEEDEIAIRVKYRMVKIHLFPNGNGRHSRLYADILISHGFGKPVFTWNRTNLSRPGKSRKNYLEALHQADDGDISPLIAFARS